MTDYLLGKQNDNNLHKKANYKRKKIGVKYQLI